MNPESRPRWRGYAVAIIAAAAAILATAVLRPYLTQNILLFNYFAVVLAAWYGGFGPALVATIVTMAGVDYFLIDPLYEIGGAGVADLLRLIVFGGVGVLIGTMHRHLRRTLAGEHEARRRAERTASHLALVAEASELLASSLDVEETLRNVAGLAVPTFADWCAVDLLEGDDLRRVAVQHPDPRKVQLAFELQERYPQRRDPDTGVWHVIRTGEPEIIEVTDELLRAAAHDEEHLRILRDLRLRSAVVAPLKTREGVAGVLTFVRESDAHGFSDAEVRLAEDLARRGGTALDNARLLRETEAARAQLQEQASELEAQTEELQQIMEELEAATVELEESNAALGAEKASAQEALAVAEDANRAKGQFLATMSHELRTPLNAITGYTELINLEVHGVINAEQRSALERIERNSKHLLGLINNILNFAKLEAGQVPIRLEPVAIAPLLASMEALIAPQLRGKKLHYEHADCGPHLLAWADRERTEQVLLNLLTNAVKFTEPGGSVTTTCSEEGDRVAIAVHDTGRGIPPEKLEAIFEPFVQLDASRTAGTEGVGLGLAISRELARAMKGDLRARSEEGKGSTFTLMLPRSPEAIEG